MNEVIWLLFFLIRLTIFLLGVVLWTVLGTFVYLPLWLLEWLLVLPLSIGGLVAAAFKNDIEVLREVPGEWISDLIDQFLEYWEAYPAIWHWLWEGSRD